MPPDQPACARAQHGLFTREQAYAAGWTARQVRRRLTAGRWRVVAGAALGVAGPVVGPWQLAAAVALTWPDAVISHELAGALWGFPIPVPQVGTATVPRGRKVGQRGLRAVRRQVLPGQVVRLRGLPVTDQARTGVDLLASLPWDDARALFAWLSTRNRLSVRELEIWVATRSTLLGTGQLRRLVAVSAGGSLSPAEDRLHALLRAAGLTGWRPNVPIRLSGRLGGRVTDRMMAVVDVLFEAERVVVEVDGWGAHGSRAAFQRDRSTQNALVAAGYVVLRFTWADLTERPEQVVATVRAALDRGGRRTAGSMVTH